MSKQIDARERHPSTRRWRRHAAPALLAVSLVLGGCGSGDAPPPIATAPLEACSTAFAEASGTAKAGTEPVRLSQCQFDASRNVTIGGGGCGPDVIIDRSFTDSEALGKITIAADGKLALPRSFEQLEVHTAGISVAGRLSLGTAACPVGLENPTSKVKVVFTGTRAAAANRDTGSDKGIEVLSGGVLYLYGNKGVTPAEGRAADDAAATGISWTHLSKPAGPAQYQTSGAGIGVPVENGGDSVLHLARDVTQGSGAWRAGDWIVVATSSFSPFESEFVQIDSLASDGKGGTDVRLKQALRHYHFGSADPGRPGDANYGAKREVNFGVDERSEVGLISRNIILTAQTPDAGGAANPDLHWGGEIRILEGFGQVAIQGVELEKFGKERLGSYPIHFHMVGDAKGRHLINSNSIHHSYNKCVTVHSSADVTIQNNVCARAVGHLFYQEMGDELRTRFLGNLGLGAMSHYFGIDASAKKTADGMVKNWWEGDNLARSNRYDGLNVRNMDNQSNPTRGGCYTSNGSTLVASRIPSAGKECKYENGELYVEQASGFWIVNPATEMVGNSIGGCQGMGKGYWYVAPPGLGLEFQPVGKFSDNRVHACYDGVFAETEGLTVTQQLFPRVGGKAEGRNLITRFEGLTATRNRNRGIWIRPTWNVIEHGRFATNRDSATLVSSGGPDGNAPGVWALMQDSVLVGVSANNVDRWGPCPTLTDGENSGCVDYNPKANELADKRYQTPFWNSAGYMVYDGPVRVFHNHFVNFLRDPSPLLTTADAKHMKDFRAYPNQATVYEGDAAFGWFQSNQSAYPTASTTRALSFENVDLRHQIYTENVNQAPFKDGDKNTALIDLDGTLTGFKVVGPNDTRQVPGEFAISLNNLAFNRASNAVDECLATGEQDLLAEGRATSIISPANMATLEFDALYPLVKAQRWQDMVFTRTFKDVGVYQQMALQSRNGQGLWEPKLTSGHGYIVESAPSTSPEGAGRGGVNGMPNVVQFGFTDAVKPDMDKKPFYVRLGIRYVDKDGRALAAGDFKVERGYRSWGGNGVHFATDEMRQYFNRLDGSSYGNELCYNLNEQNDGLEGRPRNACPANGVMAVPAATACPAGSVPEGGYCIFKKKTLTPVASLAELARPDGTPSGDNYFYDAASGMLFLYVQQDSKNAHGIFPLGSCPGDPACPDANELDTYFPCPPQGCVSYSVTVDEQKYSPGRNTAPFTQADFARFDLPEPPNQNRLAYIDENGNVTGVVRADAKTAKKNLPHWTPDREPWCPITTPIIPRQPKQSARAVSTLTTAMRPAEPRRLAALRDALPPSAMAALPVCSATATVTR